MSSRSRILLLLVSLASFVAVVAARAEVLRIAADPNNLPFSNDKFEGFENKLAAIIASDLGAEVDYLWHAQRRGFFRETLKEGNADLVMAVPRRFERALTTRPYYTSTYVFVTRTAGPQFDGFDDPRLKESRIGVQLIGDDGVNTPPAHALAARGLVTNLVGFTLYGDYSQPNPPARIIDAVADGAIDTAVVWGPLAGYFRRARQKELQITIPKISSDDLPLTYSICIGVRKDKPELRDRIDAVLERRISEIERVLLEYGVPLVSMPPPREKK